MAERLLNNLINAVTNLRDNPDGNNSISSGQPPTASETTNEALRRLYPSINAPSVLGNASTGVGTLTQFNTPEDRSLVNSLPRFDPNTNYRPRKGKRNPARQNKRKCSESSSIPSSKGTKARFKDVVLLPSPKIDVVPRGKSREALYMNGFAESAVEISDDMSEQTIKENFTTIFQRKLRSIPEPHFEFVRAIGNKIIPVPNGNFTGKMLKYLAKQRPIYIRAKSDLEKSWRNWFKEVMESNPETSEESEDDMFPCSLGTGIQINTVNSCASVDRLPLSTGNHTNVPNSFAMSDTVTSAPIISCPTCCNFFSADIIHEHADLCAKEANGIPATSRRYVEVLGEVEVILEDLSDGNQTADDDGPTESVVDETSNTSDVKAAVSAAIKALKVNMSANENRVHVRRKKLWDDFLQTRKSSKWFKPDGVLRIVFIGEPAVDGGGPRREFFTECLDQLKLRLFCDGEPVNSTFALASGDFKYAGELMASSIIQGGPAPNFLAPWVYTYITCGLDKVQLSVDLIQDENVKYIVEKIQSTTSDAEFQNVLMEDKVLSVLSSVGYRGIPSRDTLASKEKLIKSICIKSCIEPKIPMIKELQEGLNLFGVLNAVRQKPKLFEGVFMETCQFEITLNELLDSIEDHYSQSQFLKEAEEDVFKYFSDTIQSIAYSGLPNKLSVTFLHGCKDHCRCRPSASTCSLTLTLPVHADNATDMQELLKSSLTECCGFGNV